MRYLLITHIPFARLDDGTVQLDRLWAEDLKGLAASVGPIRVAAPEILDHSKMQSWGTGFASLDAERNIEFIGLPVRGSRFDLTYGFRLRAALRNAVEQADLVHTSNLFEPNTNLYAAHDFAVACGKKTLFVVAEDFYDMLQWEWVRTGNTAFARWRRQRTLDRTHRQVSQRVATASLTFLHTPAAVTRYRSFARNAVAIRQPVHEREDVIASAAFDAKLDRIMSGAPLRIATASRLSPLKGIDFLLRAIAILERRGVPVEANIYGSGPQLGELQSIAAGLAIEHRVQFPGPLAPAEELRARLNEADVFMMPHLTSDFGRAFFDAMAAGCPVVAFRSVASQDTVRDGLDGLLTPNADAEGLAAAIAELHTDRTLLTGLATAARSRALDNTKAFWNEFRVGLVRELFDSK